MWEFIFSKALSSLSIKQKNKLVHRNFSRTTFSEHFPNNLFPRQHQIDYTFFINKTVFRFRLNILIVCIQLMSCLTPAYWSYSQAWWLAWKSKLKPSYNKFYFVSNCLEKNVYIVQTFTHKRPLDISRGNLSKFSARYSKQDETFACSKVVLFEPLNA